MRVAEGAAIAFSMCALLVGACDQRDTGPATVAAASEEGQTLQERERFVEEYVRFQRDYLRLEYKIRYHNNSGGMIPGPSDWDIRLIAEVPEDTLEEWIPEEAPATRAAEPPAWVADLLGAIERSGLTEWYRVGGREVGVDRERAIVVYRNRSVRN